MGDVGARRRARRAVAKHVEGRARARDRRGGRILDSARRQARRADDVAGGVEDRVDRVLEVLPDDGGQGGRIARSAVVAGDFPAVEVRAELKLAVHAEDQAPHLLVGGRPAALQVHARARHVEVVWRPVWVHRRMAARLVGRLVGKQRRLDCRPRAGRQVRIVEAEDEVALRLAGATEKDGVVLRLRDEVGRVGLGEPRFGEHPRRVGQVEIGKRVDVDPLEWREKVGRL